ncbi:ABC-F family ATP-binding cassette domain-containing protein, partial [bacterium]|nr:ABC-F family ATP-binding cassette domain-containing protein [bacterium]
GQKSRLSLARLLVRQPELLVLDEPTNHLDLQATEWLEGFLSACAGAVILISHDRYFLDRTVTQIAEIERRRLVLYPGGYTAYAAEKQRRVEQQRKLYEAQQELIERTEEFIRRNIAGQKTRQAQSRRKMLEKMERIHRPAAGGRGARFNLSGSDRGGDHVLSAEGVTKSYDARTLFRDVTFTLRRGDRMGIVGPNGVGKTTLLKVLAGRLPKDRGEVLLGHRVSVGYYDQERTGLNPDSTVLEEIRSVKPPEEDEALRAFLGRFLFSGDEVHQVAGTLSGGEQSRVALAKLIFARPNLLLLDEPTNHLDIRSRTALEDALSDFDGTILTVSHDRYFLNRIARSILCLDGDSWGVYYGDYDAYVQARNRQSNFELRPPSYPPASGGKQVCSPFPSGKGAGGIGPKPEITKAGRKALYEQARRADRERERRERRFAQIEEEIMSLEGQILGLDEEMSRPEVAADWGRLGDLSQRRAQLKAAADRLYEEWEKMEREEGLGCA